MTLDELRSVMLRALSAYPELHTRYVSGDPTITVQLDAILHLLVEIKRDVDISELEPFVKSRVATILADATNKGILPLATPHQHYIQVKNNGTAATTLSSGRVIADGQGRLWRLLDTANTQPGETVEVLAEQSEVRYIEHQINITEPFHQYEIELQDELHLVKIGLKDQNNNSYKFVNNWMNTAKGDRTVNIRTNSFRKMIVEFGDSNRFGKTAESNDIYTFEIIETHGEIDVTGLKEASIEETLSNNENKLSLRFKEGGLVRMGADPLTVDQMRLLASYPTHDDNAVFLGNFDFLVRKKFMTRTDFISVWNETVNEKFYGADYRNINHLFVTFVPKHASEAAYLQQEICDLIEFADNLYSADKIVFVPKEDRQFNLTIKAVLPPVHNIDSVKEQIRTLMLGRYGRGTIATSYFAANGLSVQEMISVLSRNIPAFQDRQSDFRVIAEDLSNNPIKPHQHVYMTADSITLDIQRSSVQGETLWSAI